MKENKMEKKTIKKLGKIMFRTVVDIYALADKIGWLLVSRYCKIPAKFLEEDEELASHLELIRLFRYSKDQEVLKLVPKYFDKIKDRLNVSDILYNKELPTDIYQWVYEKGVEEDLNFPIFFSSRLYRIPDLSEEFIDAHANVSSYFYISAHHVLTESFCEKYANRLEWNVIFCRYDFPDTEWIRDYEDRVSWYIISDWTHLPSDIILRHIEEASDTGLVTALLKLTEREIETSSIFSKYATDRWKLISLYKDMSIDFIIKHIKELDISTMVQRNESISTRKLESVINIGLKTRPDLRPQLMLLAEELAHSAKHVEFLSIEFIKDHIEDINPDLLSYANENIEVLIELYPTRLSTDNVIRNKHLTNLTRRLDAAIVESGGRFQEIEEKFITDAVAEKVNEFINFNKR